MSEAPATDGPSPQPGVGHGPVPARDPRAGRDEGGERFELWLRVALAVALFALAASVTGCKSEPSSNGATSEGTPAGAREASLLADGRVSRWDDPGLAPSKGDLETIVERGELRVLVEETDDVALPRPGAPTFRERVLASEAAARLGVSVRFVVVERFEQLVPLLLEGKGDLIAASMTATDARDAKVDFTFPLASVREVVVGRKGAKGLPSDAVGLKGREVHVRKSSAYLRTLKEQAPGVKLVEAPEHLTPETLAYEVGEGKRPLTVIDSHLLEAMESYAPAVEGLFTLGEPREIAWAVREESAALRRALDAFLTERAVGRTSTQRFTGDLDAIRDRGVLRVLTRNNPVSYFLHRGRELGFDHDVAKMAAEALGLRMEVVVAPSREHLIPWLLEGRGDVIAASFTVTDARAERVAFTEPYLHVDTLLVQRAGAPPLVEDSQQLEAETAAGGDAVRTAKAGGAPSAADRSALALAGRTIHARRSSSHWTLLDQLERRLKALEPDASFERVAIDESMETEALLDRVASGDVALATTDSHLFAVEQAYGGEPRFEVALRLTDDAESNGRGSRPPTRIGLSGGDEIAFAVRPGNPELRDALSAFVRESYRGLEYNMARKRYFENRTRFARAKEERSGKTGVISPYDDLIRKYSERYGLDWRLMAAQAYAESGFDPDAKSWVGALGLFQVMPETGAELGFHELSDPEQGVHAGIRYFSKLLRNLSPTIPVESRIPFALAAYNAGIGHLIDARRLAERQGLDPDQWFGHVEKAMLLLEKPEHYEKARFGYCRGSEPVGYVEEIWQRYQAYRRVTAAAEATPR